MHLGRVCWPNKLVVTYNKQTDLEVNVKVKLQFLAPRAGIAEVAKG